MDLKGGFALMPLFTDTGRKWLNEASGHGTWGCCNRDGGKEKTEVRKGEGKGKGEGREERTRTPTCNSGVLQLRLPTQRTTSLVASTGPRPKYTLVSPSSIPISFFFFFFFFFVCFFIHFFRPLMCAAEIREEMG